MEQGSLVSGRMGGGVRESVHHDVTSRFLLDILAVSYGLSFAEYLM